jgi:hypothetical protein
MMPRSIRRCHLQHSLETLLASDTLVVLPAKLSEKPFQDSDVINVSLDTHSRHDASG